MKLTDQMALDILEGKSHRHELQAVKLQESTLRVFTEELDKRELHNEIGWKHILKTVEKRVGQKFDRVCDFIRYPLPVVELTDSVLGDYYKVFDGKNKYFNIEADRDITRLHDWTQDINLENWIEEHAKDVFKNKPCSFVVIDAADTGEPYCIFVDSSRLIDAKLKKGTHGDLEYIAFVHSVVEDEEGKEITRHAVYDDENYFVFIKNDDGTLTKDEVATKPHTIGYCPATSFVKEVSNSQNPFKRRTAFGTSISKLEDWTIFDIFRNYVDHYAPFPVTESLVSRCGNPQCTDGAIKEEETILDGPRKGETRIKHTKCPVCDGNGKGSQYVGPGTHIGIKHQPSANIDDGSGKFKMIFPETDKLEYTPKKLDDLEIEIRYKTVGVNTIMNQEAVNEMQAKGSFVSMETVLLRTKTLLDELYIFIVETAAKMMYTNIEVKVDADHGTEWYLMSEEDLQSRFDNAKKIGLPINEVTSIYRQLIETKYDNNKSKRDREVMMIDLQDFPFYSIEECIKLKKEGALDAFQLSLKTNFYSFIKRFERENGTITMFGANLDYGVRVDRIKEALEVYNQEVITAQEDRAPEEAPTPPIEPVV